MLLLVFIRNILPVIFSFSMKGSVFAWRNPVLLFKCAYKRGVIKKSCRITNIIYTCYDIIDVWQKKMRITPKCDIMFNDQEKHISKGVILRISITEVARFRQQVIKYFLKNGVTKASIRYRASRNSIYRWRKRYDGTWQSLKDRSHRPKSHPKQHTKQEHDSIMRYYHRNKDDKIVLWICGLALKSRHKDAIYDIIKETQKGENFRVCPRLDLLTKNRVHPRFYVKSKQG